MSKTLQQYCWEPNAEYFALVSNNNKIQLFNTISGDILQELVLPFHLSTVYSSICWSPKSTVRKEKKARKQKFGKSFIACGTTNGKVIIWNVDRKEVVREISTGTGNPVYVDFVNPTTLLLGSKPKFLATCLFTEGEKTLSNIDIGKDGITGVGCSKGLYFAVGTSSHTRIFDISSKGQVMTLQGHPTGTTQFAFLKDDFVLVASEDQYINLFSLKNNQSTNVSPLHVLSLEDNPICIDIRNSGGENVQIDILAVTQGGKVYIWRIENIEKKGKKPQTKIVAKNGVILSAKFDPNNPNTVVTVAGTPLHPVFERVVYFDGKEMIKNIQLTKDVNKKVLAKGKRKNIEEEESRHDESVILGPVNMELPGARYKQAFGDIISEKVNGDVDKIKDIEITIDKTEEEKDKIPEMKFTSSLIQALKFKDQTMINKCLNITDVDLIKSSVKQLPAQLSVPFIEAILDRYQDNNVDTGALMHWLRAILVSHTSHIMSQPDIIQKLSPLYHSIESRLSVFPSLLDLSGRLDLLLSLAGYQQTGMDDDLSDMEDAESDTEENKEMDDEEDKEEIIQVKSRGTKKRLKEISENIDDIMIEDSETTEEE